MQINIHRNALMLFVLAISMLFIGKAKFAEAYLFGWDVSESGGNVLVGSPNYYIEGTRTGAAFLFDSNTGGHLQTFVNPTSDYADQFGLSVAGVNGNVLVGAWHDDTGANDAGAAYLFNSTSGDVLDNYFSPSPAFAGYFSTSVATVGEKVFIGEPANGLPGSGNVYLIESTTGGALKTFVNPNPAGTHFGCSVAAIGNNVLVGASGEAFLFDITNGDLIHTFTDPNPDPDEYGFGSAVSISEDKAIIRNHLTGMTYVYDISSGTLIRSHSTESQAGGHKSITFLNDNYILGNATKSEVYLFEGKTGTLLQTFYKPNYSVDEFGWSVATVGDDIIVGCRDFGFGEAYLFDGISGDLIHTFNTDLLSDHTSAVPEPSTMLLVGIGLAGFAGFRKKYRKR